MSSTGSSPPDVSALLASVGLQDLQAFADDEWQADAEPAAVSGAGVAEDWALSQFWYDDACGAELAQMMLGCNGGTGRLGFLSAPTAFAAAKKLDSARCDGGDGDGAAAAAARPMDLFEVDDRFERLWGGEFHHYDCTRPLSLDPKLEGAFDALIADPPFLNAVTLGQVRGGAGGGGAGAHAGAPADPAALSLLRRWSGWLRRGSR